MTQKGPLRFPPQEARISHKGVFDVMDLHRAVLKVKNEKALTKGETYCGTFCPRGTC